LPIGALDAREPLLSQIEKCQCPQHFLPDSSDISIQRRGPLFLLCSAQNARVYSADSAI
jgi:hypothetical protein